MPFIAFTGAGFLRLVLFALAPAYIEIVGLKATEPAWKPEETLAHQRPYCDFGAFFASKYPYGGSVGAASRLTGFGSSVRYFHPRPIRRPSRGNEWRRFQNSKLESNTMTASVLSFFVTAEARAIARAALSTYLDSTAPNFRHELADRLNLITESLEHLESITCEAAFREADLNLQSLYSVIRLITRETRMLGALVEAMFNEGKGGRS